MRKRFAKPSSSASSPESASQRLSFCKPTMPYSPWYSPQKLLDGNQRIEDSLDPAPDRLSPRSRRQINQIRNLARSMTPGPRQQVAPAAPGSLRMGRDSSTHPRHSGYAPAGHQAGLAGQNEAQRWHHQHHKRDATSAESYAAQTPQIHYGFLIAPPP